VALTSRTGVLSVCLIHSSAWKTHSRKFALTYFSEVVAPASQLCYLVCKRSCGEREEGGVKMVANAGAIGSIEHVSVLVRDLDRALEHTRTIWEWGRGGSTPSPQTGFET
jgi:hypothetical protein